MLNARKCMWGMDTWGDVSSKGTWCQAVKDIWKAFLGLVMQIAELRGL
jgi:hypothetical protein